MAANAALVRPGAGQSANVPIGPAARLELAFNQDEAVLDRLYCGGLEGSMSELLGKGVQIEGIDGVYNYYQIHDAGGNIVMNLYVQQTIEIYATSG